MLLHSAQTTGGCETRLSEDVAHPLTLARFQAGKRTPARQKARHDHGTTLRRASKAPPKLKSALCPSFANRFDLWFDHSRRGSFRMVVGACKFTFRSLPMLQCSTFWAAFSFPNLVRSFGYCIFRRVTHLHSIPLSRRACGPDRRVFTVASPTYMSIHLRACYKEIVKNLAGIDRNQRARSFLVTR